MLFAHHRPPCTALTNCRSGLEHSTTSRNIFQITIEEKHTGYESTYRIVCERPHTLTKWNSKSTLLSHHFKSLHIFHWIHSRSSDPRALITSSYVWCTAVSTSDFPVAQSASQSYIVTAAASARLFVLHRGEINWPSAQITAYQCLSNYFKVLVITLVQNPVC